MHASCSWMLPDRILFPRIPQKPEDLEIDGGDGLCVFSALDPASLSAEDEVASRAQGELAVHSKILQTETYVHF